MVFAAGLVRTSAHIADQLHGHATFQEADEVAFALPSSFDHEDYVQTSPPSRSGSAQRWGGARRADPGQRARARGRHGRAPA